VKQGNQAEKWSLGIKLSKCCLVPFYFIENPDVCFPFVQVTGLVETTFGCQISMKVVDPQSALLTNAEVYDFLKSHKPRPADKKIGAYEPVKLDGYKTVSADVGLHHHSQPQCQG
jgi:hypothetical protein